MDKTELIKKFLANKCTAEEAALVEQILEEEPQLVQELLHPEEWESAAAGDPAIQTDDQLKQEIWHGIAGRTRKPAIVRSLLKWGSVAAGILLIVTALLYLSGQRGTPGQVWSNTFSSPDSTRTMENLTAEVMEVTLHDGSVVTLYPGATIQYNTDFSEQRTIHLLAGKAGFDVAKATQPFTVLSGNISTTALGTKFIVDQTGGKVNVRLYEGKVLVKPLKNTANLPPAILSPGKQCIINAGSTNYIIASLNNESFNSTGNNTKVPASISWVSTGSGLEFYNVSLPEAFEQLEAVFHQHIDYNPAELGKMYFTGKFTGKDSLNNILEIITSVNGLKAQVQGGNVKISSAAASAAQGETAKPVKTTVGRKVLSYENEPLETVFMEMEKSFSINIQYVENDIKGKYFTGTFSTGDAPGKILAIICKMNQLKTVEIPAGYQVMK